MPSRKFSFYSAASVAAFAGCVSYGWQKHGQFYPTVVWLWTSKPALVVGLNLGLVLLLAFGVLITRVFLGALRPAEVSDLSEQLSLTITDTLLAMTIFRSEFDLHFLVLFAGLVFLKIFHWVSRMRVTFVAQTAGMSAWALGRLAALCVLLLAADVVFLWLAFASVIERGPSVMILFAFEATLLACQCVGSLGHFALNVVDLRRDGQWHAKSGYELYLDFVAECFNMLIYTFFFAIVLSLYGMPLHLIRQIWWTWHRFASRVREVINWRKAILGMNERYADVSLEELRAADEDTTCIICREELDRGKRLPCGHVLHRNCLMDWLQRKQTCPICRVSVLVENITDPEVLRRRQLAQRAGQGGPPAVGGGPPVVGGGPPAAADAADTPGVVNADRVTPAARVAPETGAANIARRHGPPRSPFTPDPKTGMSPLQSIQVMSAQIQMLQVQLAQLHNQLLEGAENSPPADRAAPAAAVAAAAGETPSTPARPSAAPPNTPAAAETDDEEAELLKMAIQASLADQFDQARGEGAPREPISDAAPHVTAPSESPRGPPHAPPSLCESSAETAASSTSKTPLVGTSSSHTNEPPLQSPPSTTTTSTSSMPQSPDITSTSTADEVRRARLLKFSKEL